MWSSSFAKEFTNSTNRLYLLPTTTLLVKHTLPYAAYSGKRVIISGGIRLKPVWETRNSRTYYLAFNNLRISNIYQLLINGKPQLMARYPNRDTLNSTREHFVLDSAYVFMDSAMRISANHMPIKKWLRAGSGILNTMDKNGNANLMYQINDFNAEKQTYVLGNGGFQTMQARGNNRLHLFCGKHSRRTPYDGRMAL